MMGVTMMPVKSNVPAALLHDGDIIRWEDNVAVVHIGPGTTGPDAGRVLVRQVPRQSAMLGFTNRLHEWDKLQTPVYEVRPHEYVEVLIAS